MNRPTLREAFRFGFDTFKSQWKQLLTISFISFIPTILSMFIDNNRLTGVGELIANLTIFLFTSIFMACLFAIVLRVERGEIVRWEEFYPSGIDRAAVFVFASILFALAAGVVFLIVFFGSFALIGQGAMGLAALGPALISIVVAALIILTLVVGWHLYPYVVMDTKLSASESLKRAWQISKGNRLYLLGYLILSQLLNLLGILLLGVGILVTTPIGFLAGARIYRALSTNEEVVTPEVITPVTE